jgi:hypothetical protein
MRSPHDATSSSVQHTSSLVAILIIPPDGQRIR